MARDAGVVCGLPMVARVYELLAAAASSHVECYPAVAEGADVTPGMPVMEIEGSVRAVLAGERTALNLLMVLSGIATEARRWQRAAGPDLAVTDTRKTLPGLRALSKYAVRVGGAHNHRAGLYDMVLIKDNHIAYAGSIAEAMAARQAFEPESARRVRSGDGAAGCRGGLGGRRLRAARQHGRRDARRSRWRRCARPRARRVCLTEASGRITFERLPALAAAGVDRVSTSALTFARPLDFGLDARE